MRYLGQDEVTQMMGIGCLGEVRRGPDGALYQWVEGVDGLEAVRLWEAHRRGVRGALERLVAYNRADTQNLEPLMAYATREMERRLLHLNAPETIPDPTSEARLSPLARYASGPI